MTIQLQTKRLHMHLLTLDDIEEIAVLNADPDVIQFYPCGVLTRAQTEKKIIVCMFNWRNYDIPYFVMRDKRTNEFIGRCGFNVLETGDVEIEYLVKKEKWGMGYATEAVQTLLEYAKDNVTQEYLYAITAKDNIASQKVLQKCGLRYMKEELVDEQPSKYFYIENQVVCAV